MRKVYLLIAGALLFTIPASSQFKFERHPGLDARLIFHQDFEVSEGLTSDEAYDNWAKTPVDTIHELEYYAKLGTGTPRNVDIYEDPDWEVFIVRKDSTSSQWTETKPGDGIVMFNGVEQTSSKTEMANDAYREDRFRIVGDQGLDDDRNQAFRNYGEDGGKFFFQYTSGGIKSSDMSSGSYTTSTHSTAKHRRDLYVRGLDIEDESSYRLTYYIKTRKLNTWSPIFYSDLMRGYHHQRAAFSMGYKSGKDFAFSKDDFEDGKWERVTVMYYYLNGHEADAYVIYKGEYSWDDDWTWRPSDEELAAVGKTLPANQYLNYVKQPDKFFIRMSFATDSIEYSLDNITLTKSWIGGCEYYGDILRVNFGYETNLDQLVQEEKARNNMPALEIPNLAGKYFEVWCKDGDNMIYMPIRSAEYHDDGYMYLFTSYMPGTDETFKFGNYDSVFVTFHNPKDLPELTLKYTGSLYPKALDTAWVNAGKIVPDFYNEVALPNPSTKIWANVRSIDGLAPIMNKAPYEEGSFGLDASTTSLKFIFSKEVKVDDVFNGQNTQSTTGVIAYVNDEVWEPTWVAAENALVITRPSGFAENPLKGDYEIHLTQIKATNNDEGDDVFLHYHFGEFSLNPSDGAELTHSDWRSTFTDPDNNKGCVAVNTWSHSYDSSTEQFEMGEGQEAAKTKNRVYILADAGLDNCCYYISPRNSKGNGKPKYSGNVFALVNISQAGQYTIKFKAANWQNAEDKPNENVETHLYFYPKPDGNAAEFTFETFTGVAGKTDLGSFEPSTHVNKDDIKDKSTGTWPVGAEIFEYPFTVSTPGDYIFEWCVYNPTTISNSSNGLMIGNYTIGKPSDSDLSTQYVKKLISAVAAAQSKVDASTNEMYKGADLNNLNKVVAESRNYKGNFPSQYDSVVANISAIVKAMNTRIENVDLFHSTEQDVADVLASYVGDSVKYKQLTSYQALETHKNANAGWIDSLKSNDEIAQEVEQYLAEMKALDARMALIDKFTDKIAEVKAIIDAKDARKDYDEYKTMTDGYEVALKQDVITPADSVIIAATKDLNAAKNEYLFRFDYVIAKTRQIKELFALADSLKYDFAAFGGKKDSIKGIIDALEDDEPALSNILRQAAILQINKVYASKDEDQIDELGNLDVSALIPNYFLYNDAQVDRDMEKSSSGDWRIKREKLTTVIPGWTMTATSGNWYFTNKPVVAKTADYEMGAYIDWEVDGHTFIGGLRSGTQTKGVLTSIVEGLPEGYYKVGLYAYNQTSDLAFKFTTNADTIEGNLNTLMNGGKSNKFNYKEVGIDSVLVVGNLNYTIDQQSNSGSEFDMRNAVLRLMGPNPDCTDYATVVTEQEAELAKMVTIVNAPVLNGNVEYYNLGGMKIDAPKAGEILIRKTTRNGKVVVDKVLVK